MEANKDNVHAAQQKNATTGNTQTACSSASLAYLGDSVIEVWVRKMLVAKGIDGSKKLNATALDYVTAPKQAQAMKKILDMLSEEEQTVFRRARNMGHTNIPKHATASEYRSATGMEALMGYLYMRGEQGRIDELLRAAYNNEKQAE